MIFAAYILACAAQGVLIGILTVKAGYTIKERPLELALTAAANSALVALMVWLATKL